MGLKKQFLKSKSACKVTFTLPVEAVNGAKDVRVLGEFNDWNWKKGVPMKAKKGEFTAEVELAAGKNYQFRYLLDNKTWENDWAADNYVPTPFGVKNSVVYIEEVLDTTSVKTVKKVPAKKTTAKGTSTKKPATVQDKLTLIEGVGPKIEGLLKDDGIDTFAKLARASQKKLKAILTAAGSRYKMHTPATWPEQAALAAKGEWTKLQKLQVKLNGGKR